MILKELKYYPIGSYVITTNSTNPADIIGGEWKFVGTVYDIGIIQDIWVREK